MSLSERIIQVYADWLGADYSCDVVKPYWHAGRIAQRDNSMRLTICSVFMTQVAWGASGSSLMLRGRSSRQRHRMQFLPGRG